jgi:hypothetical protein
MLFQEGRSSNLRLRRVVGQATDDNIIQRMRICCIRRGTRGERIMDVVPGGTELEPQVKTGSWAGCPHS